MSINEGNQVVNLDMHNREDKTGDIVLQVEMTEVLNYALQQNRIPVLQSCVIVNNSDIDLFDTTIDVSSEFDIVKTKEYHIDCIPAHSSFTVEEAQISLNAAILSELTERVVSSFEMKLKDKAGNVVTSFEKEIVALAFDEWHGSRYYPELLAAFVTPNHDVVKNVVARAASILEKWTGDSSFSAYQSQDPNRVLKQVASIYEALQEEAISYVIAPPSFETMGQRVRLVASVVQQNQGTCLDLTLFYAACIEAVGLHPLLLLQEGHIFAGVWLEEHTFSEPVENDPSLITKRIAEGVNEIVVVECTALVTGRNYNFDQAKAIAERSLIKADALEYIIDVKRTRVSGIRPLPLRIKDGSNWIVKEDNADVHADKQVPKSLSATIQVGEELTVQSLTKLAQWERKLLDLSLRNTLLDMKFTQRTIPVLSSSLSDLEDALADGAEYGIGPRPSDWRVSEADHKNMESLADLGVHQDLIHAEFKNHRLRTFLTEAELSKSVVTVYRAAKNSLEENGANTLFLALGFLRWYQTKESNKARYAPLILLPIDIVRKSALKGYVIRLRDEEPQLNITLLQMLEQDFGIRIQGLDPLPLDEQGVDINTVFTVIRRALMSQPRWDIVKTSFIGIFSFSQFVMWNDMRNRTDALQQNKIVKSLMEGYLTWDAKPMDFDGPVPENDSLLPIPVDASQLHAIRSAANGNSFVLHGPPGTGKSQTITAIIANALAKGKSVLFVAEKMAALSVVQKRLNAMGIGPFCLELHSNKTNKRDVLNQLNEAAQVSKQSSVYSWTDKAEEIASIRADLDVYAKALHSKTQFGISLYDMIAEYVQYDHVEKTVNFDPEIIEVVTADLMKSQERALELLTVAGRQIRHPHNHPLRDIRRSSFSQQLKIEIPPLIEAYFVSLKGLEIKTEEFCAKLKLGQEESFSFYEKLYQIAKQLHIWKILPRAWAKDTKWDNSSKEINELANLSMVNRSFLKKTSAIWDEGILKIDAGLLKQQWTESMLKWALPKNLQQNRIIKIIKPYWIAVNHKLSKNDLPNFFTELLEYQENYQRIQSLLKLHESGLGTLYSGFDTDWDNIQHKVESGNDSAIALERLCSERDVRVEFAAVSEHYDMVESYIKIYESTMNAQWPLYETLDVGNIDERSTQFIENELDLCHRLQFNLESLRNWMLWVQQADSASTVGLIPIIKTYQSGTSHDILIPTYRRSIFASLIQITIEQNDVLNRFSGAVFEEKIRQFKSLDDEIHDLSKREVYYRLAARVPNFTLEANQKSEVGVLQRAIRSGGRGISIRKLFEQLPNLLPRLCPCMLMSPLSAAQYLDPDRKPFDLVIFDEASQMPTARAVGALARGIDGIIVGDPNQMPPTNFFSSNTIDEDNLDTEDLESILDDSLALNMPQSHLLWHYRSRHESLIAFSNNQFYDSKLYTFPSINDRNSKVSLVAIEGVFDRGRTRQNAIEARAVIEELIRQSSDPIRKNMSVGVVCFSAQQQNLIDDLFIEACRINPDFDRWAQNAEEPLFIKNLENVQGDERDIILFSIGYGPDSTGKIYMNFGPINREGGWRRLNVAVSRSRYEMKVFSSLRADQIDLSRSSSRGVAALKSFLEYAGGSYLEQTKQSVSIYASDRSGIAESLKSELEECGYIVQLKVGSSKFKVDLAVIDPRNSAQYILGILLDGDVYRNSKTTRDREVAQLAVLKGLGWHIHRIWSLDWLEDSRGELRKVQDLLVSLTEKVDNNPTELPPKNKTIDVNFHEPAERIASATHLENLPEESIDPGLGKTEYENYSIANIQSVYLSPELFMLNSYDDQIQNVIREVIKREAPISETLLIRRVVQSFGISRAGSRIQERMHNLIRKMRLKNTKQNGSIFYWDESQDPLHYDKFRVSTSNIRDITDVPVEEAAHAIYYALSQQIAMPKDDLLRVAANYLGYTRMGSNVVAAMNAGCVQALKTNKIIEQKEDYYALA